jgi:hypothetical protein
MLTTTVCSVRKLRYQVVCIKMKISTEGLCSDIDKGILKYLEENPVTVTLSTVQMSHINI